jgi:hypothetical protein
MKSKFYEKPVMEVTFFDNSDVITLSGVEETLSLDSQQTSASVTSLTTSSRWHK